MSLSASAARRGFGQLESFFVQMTNFVEAYWRTVSQMWFRPARFFERASQLDGERSDIVRPTTFLAANAFLIGLLGPILEIGLENVSPHFEQLLEVLTRINLASFLAAGLPILVVAWLSGLVIAAPFGDADRRQLASGFVYYVMSILHLSLPVLVLVSSGAWSALGDGPLVASDPELVRWALAAVIVAFLTYNLFLLMYYLGRTGRLTPEGPRRGVFPSRVLAVLLVPFAVALPSASATRPGLRGTAIDLEVGQDGQSVRVTYLLTNVSSFPVMLNRVDPHQLVIERRGVRSDEAELYDKVAHPTADCGRKASTEPFVVLDPGKSMVGTSYVCGEAALAQTLLRAETTQLRAGAAGFVPIGEIERRFKLEVEVPYTQDGRKDRRDPPISLD